jgi:hypothetical protein
MRVTITETKQIEISEKNKKEIALQFLYEKFNWKDSYYLNKNENSVYSLEEYCTSHRFDLDVKIREATEKDILFSEILDHIKK